LNFVSIYLKYVSYHSIQNLTAMARPRQFDAQTALSAAQDAFWAKGYNATSTRELTQAMGLTQPSLYNAFGDKRTLFLQALEDYLNPHAARTDCATGRHPSTGPGVRSILCRKHRAWRLRSAASWMHADQYGARRIG
jgi:AcrR family transcriptional regulator